MSRHRNIRNIEYDDYSDEDDTVGSFPGAASASPDTSSYLFDRNKQTKLNSFFSSGNQNQEEEEDYELVYSCMDQVYDALGPEADDLTEEEVKAAIRMNNYDVNKTISAFLDRGTAEAADEHDNEPHDSDQFDMELEDDVVFNARKQAFKQKKGPEVANPKPAAKIDLSSNNNNNKPAVISLGAAPTTSTSTLADKVDSMQIGDFNTPTTSKLKTAASELSKKEELVTPFSPSKQHRQMTASRRKEIENLMSSKADQKDNLSLVVIGHVDAGKSTIMGHLLYLFGQVSQKTMHKYEKESKNKGKGSFSFAWVLDEHEEERNRGITMDVGVTNFETDHKKITLLDAPGHRDFVPNMISGTAQADVGILVIDAAPDQFERGFDSDGQTKEHALLARSLGITQLGIAVNKLDMCGWSKERFDGIVAKMTAFLKQSGFKEKSVRFVPVSGLLGENIMKRSDPKLVEWYTGPTLIDLIDSFEPAPRDINKPFRMCISDVYKAQALGLAVAGRIEAGIVSVGDKLLVSPSSEVCVVKAIKSHGENIEYAVAGENVDIGIVNIDPQFVNGGNILCDPEHPIPVTSKFRAQIITFMLQRPILKGHTAELHYASLNEAAVITQLVSLIDKSTGESKQRKKIRALGDQVTAVVEIRAQRPLCLELFSEYKQLGRFTLREGGKTIAAGIVTELLN